MKRVSLAGVLEWGLAIVVFGVVVHAPFSVYFGTLLPQAELALKAWKELALGLLIILMAVELTRRHQWKVFLNERMVQLALAFIGLHLLLAAFRGGNLTSTVAGLMIDLRFVAALLLAYAVVRLRPSALRTIAGATIAGATVVLGFGLLQITILPDDILRGLGYSKQTITPYTTIDSNPDYVRINSTLRGPNPLGALAVVYAALVLAYLAKNYTRTSVRQKVLSTAVVASAVAILFASYSRSAYLAGIAAFITVAVLSLRLSKRVVLSAATTVVVIVIGLGLVSTTDWYSNVILHEDPESTTVAKSNDDHVLSLQTGLDRTLSQPLGAGVGSTGSASLYDEDASNDIVIENQYFFVAHESGWLGLSLFIGLTGVIMVRLWQARQDWRAIGLLASGVGLLIIGLLLPVWVDETVSIIWWSLTGAVIAAVSGIMKNGYDRRTRQ